MNIKLNIKKLVIGMALAGAVATPMSYATGSIQLKTHIQSQQKVEKKTSSKAVDLAVNNIISLQKAYQIVATKTNGRVLSAMLNTEFGAPNYEFIVLDGTTLKELFIHGETASVLVDKVIGDMPLYNPTLSLTQAIAAVEGTLSVTAFAAQLEQEETHGAYRLLAGTDTDMYEVVASGETGAVLTAIKFEDEFFGEDEGEGESEEEGEKETYIPLSQAIASAQQAASGTVISIALDMDEMEDDMGEGDDWEDEGGDDEGEGDDWEDEGGEDDDWGDDDWEGDDWEDGDWGDKTGNPKGETQKVVANGADDETQADEENQPTMYVVEMLDGDYIHLVMVNATTGEVSEVVQDPEQALAQAIAAATKWATLDTVITNAKTAQAGEVQGSELAIKDSKLVYLVFIDGEKDSFEVTVDAEQGTVLGVQSMNDEMDDEGETDD